MVYRKKLSLPSAMEILKTAENRLTSAAGAVHLAVHGAEEYFVQGEKSLLETVALSGLLGFFGGGTPLGLVPSEYIFRYGSELDERLHNLAVLNSHDVWALRAEYESNGYEFPHKAFLGVRAGKLAFAQIVNGTTEFVREQQAEELCGIISGNGS